MEFYVVNAFTSKLFGGNPAVVCFVAPEFAASNSGPAGTSNAASLARRLQEIAKELSFVETAFVFPASKPKTDYHLRFFSRTKETPFCGHATLAVAHILATEKNDARDEFLFSCQNGAVVNVRRVEEPATSGGATPVATASSAPVFTLVLRPTTPSIISYTSSKEEASHRESIATALGINAEKDIRDVLVHIPSSVLIVVVNTVECVKRVKPVRKLIVAMDDVYQKVIVTAAPHRTLPADAEFTKYDFVTRLFAPKIGIDEDAVSGASHAVLALYWVGAKPKADSTGKMIQQRVLRALQPSERGGELRIDVRAGATQVFVSGQAMTVARGRLVPLAAKL